ncbi:4-deoxy-L-threo-5-hexosulose-uronate ketol-isomerase [Abditibacteriota bacterium]|nr:4-deoxy-L-threo-5-hexosulose-uronate ketol-isomerase [Abditibacteriota bacterium]
MEIRPAISVREYQRLTTAELRADFVLENLFAPGQSQFLYWEVDRAIVGSVVPTSEPLSLETDKELASTYFCERREVGVINIGGPGTVFVDGTTYSVDEFGCLYIGRGCREVRFQSNTAGNPAKFYLMSYPAHTSYPTTVAQTSDANQLHLGSPETANERTIFQYIHEKGIKSCQLVMGFTRLKTGSVWNTMPPHTHARRSEVYLYCEVPEEAAVFHFMGPGNETRNVMMHNEQVVLSPSWSVHCGCGTQAYSFIWAMGGENQRFDDMDGIAIPDLR